jgi:hypothetical protein
MEVLVVIACTAMFVWLGLDQWNARLCEKRAKQEDSDSFKRS